MEQVSNVQSLTRAFELVELLSQHRDGMQLNQIAAAIGLHKSTVHRLLGALISLGYVRKEGNSPPKYRLTLKLFEVAGRLVDGLDVVHLARPVLEALRDEVKETVHLAIRDELDVIFVFKAESADTNYRIFSRLGMRRAMYCTAAGKALLACLPDEVVDAFWHASHIQAYTPKTITSLDALKQELDEVRAKGYALDNEETELGMRCVAAVLTDYAGGHPGAVSISAPVARMPDERIEILAESIAAAQVKISAMLGHA